MSNMIERHKKLNEDERKTRPYMIHNHSDRSNFRLRDATNKPKDIIDEAAKKGLSGIVLSDHETLAGSYTFWKHYEKRKKDLPEYFTVGIGNEIYLVDKSSLELVEANEKVRYNHFLLLAKNQRGYDFLKRQSSLAWKNSYFYRGMERVPTYKDELKELMKEYKGDIVASSACIGGELPQYILELEQATISNNEGEIKEIKQKMHNFINYLIEVFGKDDVYFELQPSRFEEQLIVNKWLPKIGKAYGIKCIITTDAHYLNKDQAEFHKQYLTASEGEREVEAFYSTTYIFSYEELLDFFEKDLIEELIYNTNEIKDKTEDIEFAKDTEIPVAHIPEKFENEDKVNYSINKFVDFDKYPHIKQMYESDKPINKYYCHLVFEGMIEKNEPFTHENLDRIDVEFDVVLAISYQINQDMASYFVLMREFVFLMWQISLVGVSRGSAACFYTNYLIDIVQINAIKYNLPYWRFLNKSKVGEWPDIDVDSESSKRKDILALVKENYGDENVLNIGTYTTEGPRQAALTACRAFGIDTETAQNIVNILPKEKAANWPLQDVFFGNEKENRKPSREVISEVAKYPGLQELMLQSQGLISGRGQHTSGLVVFPHGYVEQNAMMKTTGGFEITQYDADETSEMGGLKYDFLSINALDRIRTAMELLLKEKKIDWQGDLKSTYDKYFHPDVLDLSDEEMYDMLFEGEIISSFQFETPTGRQTLEKINARTFDEVAAANSLMRLSTDGEQPVDKYVRYKNDINEWEKDMDSYGLTEDEKQIVRIILEDRYGVCDTQELLMLLAMDKGVANYDLKEANSLRKSVAKKDPAKQAIEKEYFFKKGKENGTSENLLNYIWVECFMPTFGYAFSLPHVAGYTLILMIEMNIAKRYGAVFWKAACLTVDSGMVGDVEKGTNYGKTARALENFRDEILPPNVNSSDVGFYPDVKNNKIIYGLKPVSDINVTIAKQIIENRPYSSLNDFYEKNVTNGLLTDRKVVTLIKSGMFDDFEKDRRKLMIEYVSMINPYKEKLTMANVKKMFNKIPDEKFKKEKALYEFNTMIKEMKNHEKLKELYMNNFHSECKKLTTNKFPEDYYYDNNGNFMIEHKVFTKYYNKEMNLLKSWLQSEEALRIEASDRRQEFWRRDCLGSVEQWEMESISFYINRHELEDYPLDQFFNISNFEDMPEEPEIIGWSNGRGGKKWPKLKKYQIAGTVVDNDPNKGIATLITQFGVVQVRVGKGRFQNYHKKIMVGEGKNRVNIDDTWFKRGTKLVCIGYRRHNDFYCNAKDSGFQHTIMRINGVEDGKLLVQQEKRKVNRGH